MRFHENPCATPSVILHQDNCVTTETDTFTAVIMLPWRLTHSLPWLRYHGDWHIHCSDYVTMATDTFTAVITLPWRLTHSLQWLCYHGHWHIHCSDYVTMETDALTAVIMLPWHWHIHCSDYSTKEATERYKIQSEGSTLGWQTLTTASVAVELWARVCMTSSGGSKLRLSICNDDVKLITHTPQ